MSPTGEELIIKTESCDPENHGKGIIFALHMSKEVNRGIHGIQKSLEIQSGQIEAQGKTLRAINVHLSGIATWQIDHDKRVEAEKKATEDKRKFWEPIKSTAITTAVRWAVGGTLLLVGGALGSGLLSMARSKLEQPPNYHAPVNPEHTGEPRSHNKEPEE